MLVGATLPLRLLGNITQAQTTADSNGCWKVDLNLPSVALVAFP